MLIIFHINIIISILSYLHEKSYLAVQFRQIKHSLAEQFGQIKCSLAEQFRQTVPYHL